MAHYHIIIITLIIFIIINKFNNEANTIIIISFIICLMHRLVGEGGVGHGRVDGGEPRERDAAREEVKHLHTYIIYEY
jgi:hypothetical protein